MIFFIQNKNQLKFKKKDKNNNKKESLNIKYFLSLALK